MIKDVLVHLDGSSSDEERLLQAEALAAASDAHLAGLFVNPLPDLAALVPMDARAGAITEAEDAGADLDYIRSTAAHAQVSTTVRYSRGAAGKSRKVAELRLSHRTAKNRA